MELGVLLASRQTSNYYLVLRLGWFNVDRLGCSSWDYGILSHGPGYLYNIYNYLLPAFLNFEVRILYSCCILCI